MIRSVRRRTGIAVLAIAACAALGVVGVQSASAAASVKVTIKYNGNGFEGKVKSDKASCVAQRLVKVFKKGEDHQLYKRLTGDDGSWNTGPSGMVHGKFFATTNAKPGCEP